MAYSPSLWQAGGGAVGAGGLSSLTGRGFVGPAIGSLAGSYLGPALFPNSPGASRWAGAAGAAIPALMGGGGIGPAALAAIGSIGGQWGGQQLGQRRRQSWAGGPSQYYGPPQQPYYYPGAAPVGYPLTGFMHYECTSCGGKSATVDSEQLVSVLPPRYAYHQQQQQQQQQQQLQTSASSPARRRGSLSSTY